MARRIGLVATAFALATGLAACGGDSGGSAPGSGAVELSIGVFSDFGYDALIKEYETAHPATKIEQRKVKLEQHHTQLASQLGSGRGAADIVAIEEGFISQFRGSKDKFANLADYGAKDLKSQWVGWKWQQGTTDGGNFVLGLGTDVGGLGLCYRKDLFQAAGLPTERDEVAKLWPTWADYAKTAEQFAAKTPDVKFTDTARNAFKAIMDQDEEGFFAKKDDKFIADTNSDVRAAFDLASSLGTKKLTAALEPFSQDWNVALKQGSFATTTCPAWGLALIKEGAGEAASGKWDVAAPPGNGGNWGGSFLAVPKQGKHPKEAYELAKWLTAPEQQKRIFKQTGNLSSQPAVFKDPEVLATTNAYFSNAPTGKIFAEGAEKLRPTYRGTQDQPVTLAFNNAITRVEQGKQSPGDAFTQAIGDARGALK
ncbi:cellobiose transport system substrate-binding protein [Kibdelosporangium banguiense]|uniref:Cellobiose transport system substrate-binding protein n=1 Tax=Kibdelosporangium banguiense TaxID=1365924 RepID=A0ABS4TI75_9PSEU|nr:ABC transporter substrate-binding protein [Kibdelosporangium banguiense]MBP2324133.1 cellobiose transport system substrate-binding protein [Kibdelosporangium banguiense]